MICFFIQVFRAAAWKTKDFNIGGTGLTNTNFENICSKTKFVDTFKFYQKCLAQLSMTTSEEKKKPLKN